MILLIFVALVVLGVSAEQEIQEWRAEYGSYPIISDIVNLPEEAYPPIVEPRYKDPEIKYRYVEPALRYRVQNPELGPQYPYELPIPLSHSVRLSYDPEYFYHLYGYYP